MVSIGLLGLLVATLVSGGSPGSTSGRSEAPLRGLLLGEDDLTPRVVGEGPIPELPDRAPAFAVSMPTAGDLQWLAERHAGRTVQSEPYPGASAGEPSFGTGDGWFTMNPGPPDDSTVADALGWTFVDRDWFEAGRLTAAPVPCRVEDSVYDAARAFFARLDMLVTVAAQPRCADQVTQLEFTLVIGGVPLIDTRVIAFVDPGGRVVEAYGPLLAIRPLGDVALAPDNEIRRRLVHGPGFLAPYFPCRDCTWSVDPVQPLGLALAVNGGIGLHDHTPGGIVPGQFGRFLVPAVHVTTTYTWNGVSRQLSRGVVAVSSAEMVDDPAEVQAARAADVHADAALAECRGENDYGLGLCVSRLSTTVDAPVSLTIDGEVYVPVGAKGCDPILTLEAGDGTPPRSFTPIAGTLVTGRAAHSYAEPGTYTVVGRSESRCERPGSGGAGEETEYQFWQTLVITVLP